jgi:hypothetical protein
MESSSIHSPNEHSHIDTDKLFTPTTKAYQNNKFITSNEGRGIRILCEYEVRLVKHIYCFRVIMLNMIHRKLMRD